MTENLDTLFEQLRQTMLANAKAMDISRDEQGWLDLNAPWPNPTKPAEPMWFGGVRTGKRYVSVHLMPLYLDEELKSQVPETLRARMQGKTCFNFAKLTNEHQRLLEQLIARAAKSFAEPRSVAGPAAR